MFKTQIILQNLKIKILYQYIGKNISKLLSKYYFFPTVFFVYSCAPQSNETIKIVNIFCKTSGQNIIENNKTFTIKSDANFFKSYEKINDKKFNNANLIIQSNIKSRGGYSLNLNKIVENKIYFFEITPPEKTPTITVINYPYCEIELNIIPNNLEVIIER